MMIIIYTSSFIIIFGAIINHVLIRFAIDGHLSDWVRRNSSLQRTAPLVNFPLLILIGHLSLVELKFDFVFGGESFLHPGVTHDVCEAESFVRVRQQHPRHEILKVIRQILVNLGLIQTVSFPKLVRTPLYQQTKV